jgi:hypothetical protein
MFQELLKLPFRYVLDETILNADMSILSSHKLRDYEQVPLNGTSKDNIRNAVTTAVQNLLGYTLPGPYHQVVSLIVTNGIRTRFAYRM